MNSLQTMAIQSVQRFTRFDLIGCKRIIFSVFLLLAMLLLSSSQVFSAQATLIWNPPTTNTDGTPLTDLAGYKVYYGTASKNYVQVINIGNVSTYTVSNLTSGTTYFFAATAYDTSGNESAFSNELNKTVYDLPTLVINNIGSGTGTVIGSGINCGSACIATYNPGTVITLSAVPNTNSAFGGWSGGACTGMGTCVTTMNTGVTIIAPFNILPPIAAFSGAAVSGSAPLYVSFSDSSANSPSSWSWIFGDGYTSNSQNPVHVYKTPGLFTVSLTASNADGTNSTSKTNYITVSSCPNQSVRISRSTPVYYSTVQATYNATVTGDTIQMQALDFTENLTLNRNVSMTLKGGYDCGYTTTFPGTTIKGSLIVGSNGAVLIDTLRIQ